MGRFVEVAIDQSNPPTVLTIETGDLIRFSASGARVARGEGLVEVLGPLEASVVATTGEILTPQGTPNTVILKPVRPGRAEVDIFVGPWGAARAIRVDVEIRSPKVP